jgi:glycosyltransferase involved in cell wall biosynthesis
MVDGGGEPPAQLSDAEVAILLSTYDGAKFLPEQLASFAGQTHRRWRLLWRDDGSRDDTVALLDRFARLCPPGQVVQLPGSGQHLGTFDSFMALIDSARDAPAVALADQDDIWLPRKLERALHALAKVEPGRPALYCTSLTIVDAALRPVGASLKLQRAPGFPGALLQNIASGCTMVLNQAAARAVAVAVQPAYRVHDWWIYLLVAAIGGAIVFDDTPTTLYRQHGANSIGASWARPLLRRVIGAAIRGTAPYHLLLQQLLDALHRNEAMLAAENAKTLRRIRAALSGPWWRRVGLLTMPGFRRQTRSQTMLLALCLLRASRSRASRLSAAP